MRYQGELPKSHRTAELGGRGGAATKWVRKEVGAMEEVKHEGQMSKAGQEGRVNQSVRPRVKVVRGQEGRGAMLPFSMSSEWRRMAPTGFSRLLDGG